MSRKVIVLIVENQAGVLNRVTTLLRRRSFNIDSLTVAKMDDPSFSRMTIVLDNEQDSEQVTKQLHKLINVLKVMDMQEPDVILHESVFLKVHTTKSNRSEVLHFSEAVRAEVVDIAEKSITFRFSGSPEEVEKFVSLMHPFGIKELVRSGSIAIAKEKK